MKKPEMIIFDYGHTLLYECNHNVENGNIAAYEYIKDNPDNVSYELFNKTCPELYVKMKASRGNMEIHEHHFLKILYDYLNITSSVSMVETEQIILNGISKGAVMAYAAEMLDYLNEKGIRTAVISNLNWSGEALINRLNRLLPNNKFEFVLASSEYVFPKPYSIMYEIALKKANLTADKVRFCGDSIGADINGAESVGMFPVWYEEQADEVNPFACFNNNQTIDFEHLHIHHWKELVDILEKI